MVAGAASQCADTTRMALGLVQPSDHFCHAPPRTGSSAVIGEPCPTKATGILRGVGGAGAGGTASASARARPANPAPARPPASAPVAAALRNPRRVTPAG